MHKHVQRYCLLLSFLTIFTVLKAQDPLPPPLPDCEAVQLSSTGNNLTIHGITAPNSIVKVFDANWQLAFECNGGCEETISLSDLTAGDIYHTDIQFYDENWQSICDDRQDIEILDGDPCDDSICQGDVLLTTQAEVDAFCGCEVIEGNIVIGISPTEQSDIYSLANLSKLKTIKGTMSIINIKVTDFEELENLMEIGENIDIVYNVLLNSFKGLDNITAIPGNITILDNPQLKNIDNLGNLEQVGAITISINSQLKSIKGLSKLRKVNSLYLLGLSSLESLEGIENIDSIIASSPTNSEGFALAGCPLITDLSLLQGLKYIDGQLNIAENVNLTDCCSISHLLDDNPDNGQVTRFITFDLNPAACNSVEAILEYCDNTSTNCDDIAITTGNNDLIISGITAPNSIVKVFDANWQLAFECNGDCEETISLSGLTAGDIYHTDIQFYNENWQSICKDKQNIEILGGDPCDDSFCQGDVTFTTQAGVDAFCGCETIEGKLLIGIPIINGPPSDITSLANLHQLKRVKGNLSILSTTLTSLEGLEQLVQVDDGVGIVYNLQLTSLKGLNNLESTGTNLVLLDNPELENLDALESLVEVNGQLSINTNNKLNSIKGLSKITSAASVNVIANKNLATLEGLENIATITTSGGGGLNVSGNNILEDISSLQGIKLVDGPFNMSGNAILEDCCSIAHLIDEDEENGQVLGDVTITFNPAFCSSVEEILAKCGGTPPFSCDNIDISYANNELNITGLTAPIEIVKVFDEDWQQIFECFNDCEDEITLSNLSGNAFYVRIANYDEDWNFLCHGDQDITVAGDRGINDLLPEDFTLSPNPAYEETTIDLNRLQGETVDLKMYNQFGQEVLDKHIEKVGTVKERIDLSTISNGFYLLKIQPKGKRVIAKKIMVSRLY